MKTISFIFTLVTSLACSATGATGHAIVSVGEIDAVVRIEGQAAQTLFESLEVSSNHQGTTAIKETRELACFQYNQKIPATYTCTIFIFVNKDFISIKSRYLQNRRKSNELNL